MDNSFDEDETARLRPLNDGQGRWVGWVTAILVVLGAASYYLHEIWTPSEPQGTRSPVKDSTLGEPETAPVPPHAASTAPASAPAQGLPSLDNSDTMMRRSLDRLIGSKAFNDFVVPEALVRRIVATVDNLPRPTAPRRVMPLNAVPGELLVLRQGLNITLDPHNSMRYRPYVAVFAALDVAALVKTYAAAYPLFQRAYEELGYPGASFHERLLEAIDDMLAAPQIDSPPALVRPKVLYDFADPDLEARSAGQKIMMRIGRDGELRVKAKLKEIREALVASAK